MEYEKTLRDEFAMAALQGLLAGRLVRDFDASTYDGFLRGVCDAAYDYADAMMERREK